MAWAFLLSPAFVGERIALVGGQLPPVLLREKLLWHGAFCCSLVLPGNRLLWKGEFCCSMVLLGDKLLWHGAFCYRLVLLGGKMLGARFSAREVPRAGKGRRSLERDDASGCLESPMAIAFYVCGGGEAANRVRRPHGAGLV